MLVIEDWKCPMNMVGFGICRRQTSCSRLMCSMLLFFHIKLWKDISIHATLVIAI